MCANYNIIILYNIIMHNIRKKEEKKTITNIRFKELHGCRTIVYNHVTFPNLTLAVSVLYFFSTECQGYTQYSV